MLLSSENDESDENKTFEVYFSYITVASNIFKQTITVTLIDKGSVLWLISKKVWLLKWGCLFLTSSVQEVHVIFKWNNLQSLGTVLLYLKKQHEFCIPYFSLSELVLKCKVTD